MKHLSTLAMLAAATAPYPLSARAQSDPVQAVLDTPAGLAVPGCALGIFRNGRLAKFVTAGAADTATQRAMNADTQFYAASVSKEFTSLAAMQLVLKGKLNLDDDVHKYLPELPDYGHKVTVVMLMNHTAGIRDSLELLYLNGISDIAAPTRAQALALLFKQTATKFEPGTRYDYSNGGYLLLSEIVERVAGEPFSVYVNRSVLGPIGMTRSFIMAGARTADANVALGYTRTDGKVVPADSYPLFGGSGGLITTINDLSKYDHDIDSAHKVWTPAIMKLMLEPGRFNDGSIVRRAARSNQAYAAGLSVSPDWFSHGGSATGFKTMYARMPARRIGLGLLCNAGETDPDERINAVVAAMGEGLPPVTEAQVPVAKLDGRYRSADLDVVYVLASEGSAMTLKILPATGEGTPLATIPLKPADDGYAGPSFRLVPDADRAGFTINASRVVGLKFRRI
jgi:CubicO group peptidase (beta-lactamase class C family)